MQIFYNILVTDLQLLNNISTGAPIPGCAWEETMNWWISMGVVGGIALWLPSSETGAAGLLATLVVAEAGALAISLLPWTCEGVEDTVSGLRQTWRAIRAAPSVLARGRSQS